MDTRLKNNHKWGVLLIVLIVLAVSAATVGLYPYMHQKARAYNEKWGTRRLEERYDFGNIATQAMNFSYEIWHQRRQEEEGKLLTYSQTFLPQLEKQLNKAAAMEQGGEAGAGSLGQGNAGGSMEAAASSEGGNTAGHMGSSVSVSPGYSVGYTVGMAGDSPDGGNTDVYIGVYPEEAAGEQTEEDGEEPDLAEGAGPEKYDADYYRELQKMMDELGAAWQDLYQQYGSTLSYAVLGSDGNYVRSNVNRPEEYFDAPLETDELQFTVEFSSSGRMSLAEVSGTDDFCSRMLQAASKYEFYDPLAVRLTDSYRYSGVQFFGPKDMMIVFRCNPMIMNGWGTASRSNSEGALNCWDYLSGKGFYTVVVLMSAVLLVTALCLPLIRSFEIGRSALCRLAFEPLSCIGIGWLCLMAEGSIPASLVAYTIDGSLKEELLEAGFLGWSSTALTLAANLIFWCAVYGSFYWGITCYRGIFSLGPWRYFKERTWAGRFLRFIKGQICRGLNVFQETDWESRSSKIIGKAVIANFLILALISCLWFWGIGALVIYSFVLFFMLRKYWGQMQEKYQTLLNGINQLAEGNLDVEIREDLGIFNPFKEQLGRIQEGFKKAVAQEVKSERTKSELITNVSHDLKTPLTAIITYVNLLKQEGITEEERNSYIQILDRKSMRLKALIEDLFEVSKASSGTVTLHLEQVDIVSLLKQVRFELADKIESCGVEFRYQLPEKKLVLTLDGQKTCRIFENLLVNITKYGLPGTRAYIQVTEERGGWVCVSMRNISAKELDVAPEELTERFVRGDQSRNTEGSGLGLAIVRSFVEVQGGAMKIDIEDDIFRVIIRWRRPECGEEKGPEGEAGSGADRGPGTGAGTASETTSEGGAFQNASKDGAGGKTEQAEIVDLNSLDHQNAIAVPPYQPDWGSEKGEDILRDSGSFEGLLSSAKQRIKRWMPKRIQNIKKD